MHSVYLLLGSNLGDRNFFLQKAKELIEIDIAPVSQASSVYETQPLGNTDAPDYFNQVVKLETSIPALNLLEKLLNIEVILGRLRKEKWGSRTIDIDILLYGEEIINAPGLQIPHPEMHKRGFTLAPLAEIAPALIHPVLNKNILQLKNDLKDSLIVKKL